MERAIDAERVMLCRGLLRLFGLSNKQVDRIGEARLQHFMDTIFVAVNEQSEAYDTLSIFDEAEVLEEVASPHAPPYEGLPGVGARCMDRIIAKKIVQWCNNHGNPTTALAPATESAAAGDDGPTAAASVGRSRMRDTLDSPKDKASALQKRPKRKPRAEGFNVGADGAVLLGDAADGEGGRFFRWDNNKTDVENNTNKDGARNMAVAWVSTCVLSLPRSCVLINMNSYVRREFTGPSCLLVSVLQLHSLVSTGGTKATSLAVQAHGAHSQFMAIPHSGYLGGARQLKFICQCAGKNGECKVQWRIAVCTLHPNCSATLGESGRFGQVPVLVPCNTSNMVYGVFR